MSQDNTERPQRRIVLPTPPKRVEPSSISLLPEPTQLISDALTVIATEIIKFKTKVSGGQSLDINEGRLLNNYIRSLCELSKESREREAEADFANMSNEDLLALVQKIQTKKQEPASE